MNTELQRRILRQRMTELSRKAARRRRMSLWPILITWAAAIVLAYHLF